VALLLFISSIYKNPAHPRDKTVLYCIIKTKIMSNLEEFIDTFPELNSVKHKIHKTYSGIHSETLSSDELLCGTIFFYAVQENLYIAPNQIQAVAKSPIDTNIIVSTFYFVADYLSDTVKEIYFPTPEYYAYAYATTIETTERTQSYIPLVFGQVKETTQSSGTPNSIQGAAIVYLSGLLSGERITQYELAQVSNRSEAAIRNQYQNFNTSLRFPEHGATTNWTEIQFTINTLDHEFFTSQHKFTILSVLEAYFDEKETVTEDPLSLIAAALYLIDPTLSLENIKTITSVSKPVTSKNSTRIEETEIEIPTIVPAF
jgi:hypothetical protein